jgi:vacuolar iron transporter family protein
VLGGSDGAIEAVATTAALNGAGIPFHTILVAGLAFALAGGLSMFFSSYLSNRSEVDLLRLDVRRERMEIETEPEEERAELEALLKKEGYEQKEVDVIMERMERNRELWLRTQLSHELRLHVEDLESDPLTKPAAAGVAFALIALACLSPYAIATDYSAALIESVGLALASLFVLSSRLFTPGHLSLRQGAESVAVGGIAALALYAVGVVVSGI